MLRNICFFLVFQSCQSNPSWIPSSSLLTLALTQRLPPMVRHNSHQFILDCNWATAKMTTHPAAHLMKSTNQDAFLCSWCTQSSSVWCGVVSCKLQLSKVCQQASLQWLDAGYQRCGVALYEKRYWTGRSSFYSIFQMVPDQIHPNTAQYQDLLTASEKATCPFASSSSQTHTFHIHTHALLYTCFWQ